MRFDIVNKVMNGVECEAVDARQLHEALGVKTRYNDWIARQIKELGLARDVDYVGFYSILSKNQGRGRPTTEYMLTAASFRARRIKTGLPFQVYCQNLRPSECVLLRLNGIEF